MRKPYTLEIVDGVAKGTEVNPFVLCPIEKDYIKAGYQSEYNSHLKSWLQAEQSMKSFVICEKDFINLGLYHHQECIKLDRIKFTAELNAENKLFNIEIL